jgi:hypothetical protein
MWTTESLKRGTQIFAFLFSKTNYYFFQKKTFLKKTVICLSRLPAVQPRLPPEVQQHQPPLELEQIQPDPEVR